MPFAHDIKPILSTIRSRLPIAEVFQQYGVSLRRSGADYVALCPFHREKTPSCHLYTKDQTYHCFGCGAHGDVLDFVMQHDGQSFREAVIALAGMAGVSLPESFTARPSSGVEGGRRTGGFGGGLRQALDPNRSVTPRKMREPRTWEAPPEPTAEEVARCREVVREAARMYQGMLDHPDAKKVIRERGITASSIERFALGYADGSSPVLRSLRQKRGDPAAEEALYALAGVIAQKGSDKAWADRFRHRLIFPIRDPDGHFCGMGGRYVVPSDHEGFGQPTQGHPKYINTPDTPIYHKNRMLYGLYENQNAIRTARHAFLVEGYLDVIGLYQAGIENAVASCGTALTDAQMRLLLQHTPSVTFCFDGDEAGRQAALKAAKKSLEYLTDEVRIRVMFLPDGEDPDSLMRTPNGQDVFDKLACDAVSVLDVLMDDLRARYPVTDADGAETFYREWAYYLEQIPGPSVRSGWEAVVRSVLPGKESKREALPVEPTVSPRRTRSGDGSASEAPQDSWKRSPHFPAPLSEKLILRALWWVFQDEPDDLRSLWETVPVPYLFYEAERNPDSPMRDFYIVLQSLGKGVPTSQIRTAKVRDLLRRVEGQKSFVDVVRTLDATARRKEVSALVERISRQAIRGRAAYLAWMADKHGESSLSDEERALLRLGRQGS